MTKKYHVNENEKKWKRKTFRIRESNPLLRLLDINFEQLEMVQLTGSPDPHNFCKFLKAEYVNPYTNAYLINFCLT